MLCLLKRCFKIKPLNRLTAAGGWDDLKRMAVFASVVQHGSMTGAGPGHEPVSGQPAGAATGAEGGVTLLHRSTRKLALTEAGQRYHAQCAAMCAAAEQARAELAAARDAPSGELRMSATVGFARHVPPALGAMLAQYPSLRLRLLVDDAPIDLINARVGIWRCALAAWPIRPGRHAGWGLEWWLCASPEYGWTGMAFRNAGRPAVPWLAGLCARRAGLLMDLRGPGARPAACGWSRIVSNNQLSIQQMCEAGLGGADGQPGCAGRAGIGRLVRLLPQWTMGTLDIWAVTPQRDAQPARCGRPLRPCSAIWSPSRVCWSSGCGLRAAGRSVQISLGHTLNGEEPGVPLPDRTAPAAARG